MTLYLCTVLCSVIVAIAGPEREGDLRAYGRTLDAPA